MNDFDHVKVLRKANIYFDGQVTSRTILFPDGTKKTLGIMLPGEYSFDTALKELMEISAGKLEILLPGQTSWQKVEAGDAFEVPAESNFKLKIFETTDYCCSYLKS